MKLTRRNFIQSSAVAVLAAAAGKAAGLDTGLFARHSQKGTHPLEYLQRAHFEAVINTRVRITGDNGKTSVIWLREAAELKEQINMERGYTGESFRLGFESPRKTDLVQGTYQFDHENLGRFSLFLVPVRGSGVHYEAVINQIC
jgi:hypothetical protein